MVEKYGADDMDIQRIADALNGFSEALSTLEQKSAQYGISVGEYKTQLEETKSSVDALYGLFTEDGEMNPDNLKAAYDRVMDKLESIEKCVGKSYTKELGRKDKAELLKSVSDVYDKAASAYDVLSDIEPTINAIYAEVTMVNAGLDQLAQTTGRIETTTDNTYAAVVENKSRIPIELHLKENAAISGVMEHISDILRVAGITANGGLGDDFEKNRHERAKMGILFDAEVQKLSGGDITAAAMAGMNPTEATKHYNIAVGQRLAGEDLDKYRESLMKTLGFEVKKKD